MLLDRLGCVETAVFAPLAGVDLHADRHAVVDTRCHGDHREAQQVGGDDEPEVVLEQGEFVALDDVGAVCERLTSPARSDDDRQIGEHLGPQSEQAMPLDEHRLRRQGIEVARVDQHL